MQQEKTNLQFWGGLDTIGGNIISIQHGNYRIITDFGALAGVNSERLTAEADLAELIDNQKVAAIPGLYSRKRLGNHPITSVEETEVQTIICLSHLHLDHLGSFAQLPPETPVLATQESVAFYHQLETQQLLPSYLVNWQGVEPLKPIQFGPFTITFHASDHDTLGIAAIFIETPEMTIVYSGDLRVSGFHPDRVYAWALAARAWEPDVLLLEGTSFSRLGQAKSSVDEALEALIQHLNAPTEVKLLQDIEALLQQYPDKLFAFNGYPQNIERIHYLAELAAKSQRQLIMDTRYYALYVANYGEQPGVQPFEDAATINQNPAGYILQVDFEDHQALFEVDAGVYLHSNGMPLGSYDSNYEPFVKAVHQAGWLFVDANVSGHAYPEDLVNLAYLIQPGHVVPWHSYQPEVMGEALQNFGLKVWLPKYGESYGG
ncbi:MBL fold metallo-hydrolase [Fundicoccus culcitae]|uniref:MBL fold metallo-hydrolase n=1 Tax=Fundicoccus culcitae TaxID=2969821 RepID=A0ABY5P9W5_9LACT|nr:MBL fold metallo-hydrolase [Fundicoccus culcitae]UUX35324.1 MBL fold metallo-hydrolase [Fundicoccus culcitae]